MTTATLIAAGIVGMTIAAGLVCLALYRSRR